MYLATRVEVYQYTMKLLDCFYFTSNGMKDLHFLMPQGHVLIIHIFTSEYAFTLTCSVNHDPSQFLKIVLVELQKLMIIHVINC